jgi:predicted glycoside hydrolase/deacetylase ChbG (UPF0249 family)
VLRAVARIAREFRIPWVRRPFDFGVDESVKLQKRLVSGAMRLMAPAYARTLEGLRTTDYFTGFQLTGTLNDSGLISTLKRLPHGLTEFMCHPGQLGPELQSARTRLKKSREIELAALVSPETRMMIEQHGIRLTNYREN